MRYGLLFLAVAFAGCQNMNTPSMPSKPSTDVAKTPAVSKPAMPVEPSKPVMAPPTKPSVDAPKAPGVDSPKAPTVDAPKAPVDAPKTSVEGAKVPAAAIDKTPIKADLSKIKFEGAELFGWDDGESRAFFYANGTGDVTVKVPADGEYEVVVTASCQAAKGENAKFKLKVDGTQAGAETQLKSEDSKEYTITTAIKAGDRKIGVEFTNDIYKEGEYDMNFYLHGLKLVRVK